MVYFCTTTKSIANKVIGVCQTLSVVNLRLCAWFPLHQYCAIKAYNTTRGFLSGQKSPEFLIQGNYMTFINDFQVLLSQITNRHCNTTNAAADGFFFVNLGSFDFSCIVDMCSTTQFNRNITNRNNANFITVFFAE